MHKAESFKEGDGETSLFEEGQKYSNDFNFMTSMVSIKN